MIWQNMNQENVKCVESNLFQQKLIIYVVAKNVH